MTGRKASAGVGIIDSTSVRMGCTGGNGRKGMDGNKKVKGSKRHIVVDTLGLVICSSVHPAHIHDSRGANEVFEKLYELRHDERRIVKIFADGGYRGASGKWVKTNLNMDMEIVKGNESDRREVLPKRWIAEWTFVWLMNYRRLAMDYERLPESVEVHIHIAMIMIMGKKFN
ncbi:MAG: IS5 family transposase [Chitinophagaceae bacterium]